MKPSGLTLPLTSLALALCLSCDSGDASAEGSTAAAAASGPTGAKAASGASGAATGEPKTATGEPKAATGAAEPKAATGEPEAATGEPAADNAPAKITAAGDAGPAYFMVDDKGLVMLDGGKFTPLKDSPKSLLKHFTRGGDGKLYALAYMDILRIDGDKLVEVVKVDHDSGVGTPDDFAVDAKGNVYTVSYKGIGMWDGKAWTMEAKEVLGEDVKLIEGIGIASDGQLWVASSNALHTKVGGAWKSVDTKAASKRTPFFDGIEGSPTGKLYAWTGDVVVELGPGESVTKAKLGLKGFVQLDHLSFSQSGAMAFRTGLKEVGMHDGKLTKYSAKKKQFKADSIASVTTDDQGRVWVSSAVGVVVLGPGDAKVEWLSGAVPEISGKVENIIVVGKGPELPEAGPVRTGGLRGKLLRDGEGLAGLDVELCPSPDMMFSKSPCHDSPIKFRVKSAEDGSFELKDVPLGAYGIAIKVKGKWSITMGSDLGSSMKEGKVYDIGSLQLD